MVSKVNCCAIMGTEVIEVFVETDICSGLPSFDMVGLLSSEIKESRERVRTAIKNSGFMLPPRRVTINIAPANIRKSGTMYDLPIAASILHALGMIHQKIDTFLIAGELSLDGRVISIRGVLPMVLMGLERKMTACFIPADNYGECINLHGISILGVKNLTEMVCFLNMTEEELQEESKRQRAAYEATVANREGEEEKSGCKRENDFSEIYGQEQAKIGAIIAAAGRHNMMMIGPPGSGKTAIARAMPEILPDMTFEEKIEISKIHSIAGNLQGELLKKRPFRHPHHTTTVVGMAGGGVNPKPGEVTLAHGGILYMDEFPEFSRNVLETLRQPLEDKKITISRSSGTYEFLADTILVASMNPCPCGYYPDRNHCNCTERDVNRYLARVSGPILDRFDLCIHLQRVNYGQLQKKEESSYDMKRRVTIAAQIQRERYKELSISYNAQLDGSQIREFCHLGTKEEQLMEQIFNAFHLSMRAYEKIIKVSRTIADLDERKDISKSDISKAITFRTPLWMR